MENTQQAILKRGWVFSGFDGFVGERIYPAWSGALEGKRLILRDIRVLNGSFFVHNPWKNTVHESFDTLDEVESHILRNGQVIPEGANVWD
jgi:hypothetical protein